MSSPASSSPIRLTRRGRIVITLVMMTALVVAGFTLGRGSSQAADRHHASRHTVTVEAGDTLWSVAALGILGGRALMRRVPLHLIARVAAVVMLVLAGFSLYEAAA